MADYLEILRGITGGLEAGQNFRARRQQEKAREQALESGEYDLESRRAVRRTRDPESAKVLGKLDPASVQDYQKTFGDPFAFKLLDWFKTKRAARRPRTAVPLEEVGPPSMYANDAAAPILDEEVGPPQYADGGEVELTEEQLQARRAERLRIAEEQGMANAEARREQGVARNNEQTARNGGITDEAMRERTQRQGNAGTLLRGGADAEGAINETVAPVLGPNFIPQEGAGRSTSGPRGPRVSARRSALPVDDDAAAPAQALPSVAAGTGNAQSGAAAPRGRSAIPTEGAAGTQTVDFSQLDVDAKDVPNMTTDDWKEYRAKIVDAARLSGRPEAISQANKLVTEMQQEGFLNYGQQGLALQQAGNLKGAMAAYRAAFQYFPNGNDVEFGLIKDSKGQQQIVGYGRDEKTKKIVEGSQIVMNPEQAARLLENFSKPEAFRAWTKDWRDFEEGKRRYDSTLANKQGDDAFRNKRYEEVEKPLAQAQADSLANNSEANIARAERSGSGALRPRDLQSSERTFRERLGAVGLTDEAQMDYLASVMSRIKTASPNTPDNQIIDSVMRAQKDGTLAQRLKSMGIQ